MEIFEKEQLFGLAISEDLIPQPAAKASTTVSMSFSDVLSPPLCLQTNQTKCGGQLWPAGMVLAEYLLRTRKDELRGKTMFVRPGRCCCVENDY